MSALKEYFKLESRSVMLSFEHNKPSDFYLSVWQTTRSPVPLLIWRTLLLLLSFGITLSSVIIYIINGKFSFWFIYLTHWGLLSIVFATAFATGVSARCYIYGPISAEFKLPWYVRTYWVLYNIAVPFALLITIFYWSLLYEEGIEEELNHGLDVAVHGLNSVVMLLLLMTSSQPSRLLHIYQPAIFGLIYVIFGVIYHLAGGQDQLGNPYIYPVIYWANPGKTFGIIVLTAVLLIILHFITIGLAVGRDTIAKRIIRVPVTVHLDEGLPLRQPNVVHSNSN